MTKEACLSEAIEIIKEYARGGGELGLAGQLESVYTKLVELSAGIE